MLTVVLVEVEVWWWRAWHATTCCRDTNKWGFLPVGSVGRGWRHQRSNSSRGSSSSSSRAHSPMMTQSSLVEAVVVEVEVGEELSPSLASGEVALEGDPPPLPLSLPLSPPGLEEGSLGGGAPIRTV